MTAEGTRCLWDRGGVPAAGAAAAVAGRCGRHLRLCGGVPPPGQEPREAPRTARLPAYPARVFAQLSAALYPAPLYGLVVVMEQFRSLSQRRAFLCRR